MLKNFPSLVEISLIIQERSGTIKTHQKTALIVFALILLIFSSCGGNMAGENTKDELSRMEQAKKSGKPMMVEYYLTT